MLSEAYGNQNQTFSEGKDSVKDDHPSRPGISTIDENIANVRGNRKDRRLNRESVPRILREEMKMMKVCAKRVSKVQSDEEKERKKEICSDLLEGIDGKSIYSKSVIGIDEMWMWMWRCTIQKPSGNPCLSSSPRVKKALMSRWKFKVSLW